MTQIINLTPHAVVIYDNDGKTILATVQPSGDVARVSMTRQQMGVVPLTDDARAILDKQPGSGIPVYVSTAGDVTGVPALQTGKIYLVSAMVRLALKNRLDVLSPGELIRNEAGQPVGCKGLEANA